MTLAISSSLVATVVVFVVAYGTGSASTAANRPHFPAVCEPQAFRVKKMPVTTALSPVISGRQADAIGSCGKEAKYSARSCAHAFAVMDAGFAETTCTFARKEARAFFTPERAHDVAEIASQCAALHRHLRAWHSRRSTGKGKLNGKFSFPRFFTAMAQDQEEGGARRGGLPRKFQYFLLCMEALGKDKAVAEETQDKVNYHVIGGDMLLHTPRLGVSLEELMCATNQLRKLVYGGDGKTGGLIHGAVEFSMVRDGVPKTMSAISHALAGPMPAAVWEQTHGWLLNNAAHGVGHGIALLWNATGFELRQLSQHDPNGPHDPFSAMYIPTTLPKQYRWMWGIMVADGASMVFAKIWTRPGPSFVAPLFPARRRDVPRCRRDDVRCKTRLDIFVGWYYAIGARAKQSFARCRLAGYGNRTCGFASGFAYMTIARYNGWPVPPRMFHDDNFTRNMFLFAYYLRTSFNNAAEQHVGLARKLERGAAIDGYCESYHDEREDQGICKHALRSAYTAFRQDTPCSKHWFIAQ